jgi:pyrroline-5-carboxylate reductase
MKIAIIGCGVMGSALARHFALNNKLMLFDRSHDKTELLAREVGAEAASTPTQAIESAEMVLLAFKPKDLAAFAKDEASSFKPGQIVVSILAGTSIALLKLYFPQQMIVRALPNLPLVCGEGVIGLTAAPEVSAKLQKSVVKIFNGLGLLKWLSEDHLEALSALAGSGPAFVLLIIQGMIDSGIALGLTPDEAYDLVLQTIEGSVALLKSEGRSPEELIRRVASPGGTTEAGLKVMRQSGITDILLKTYKATFLRARELQK